MKMTSVGRLTGGVAVAVMLSAAAVWAQTSSGETTTQTQQGTQTQQQLKTQQQTDTQTSTQQKQKSGTEQQMKTEEQAGGQKQKTEEQAGGQQQKSQQQTGTQQKTDTQTTQKQKTDVDVSVEQRTKIKQTIKSVNVEPVEVDFSVSVGAVVPSTVVLHTLPVEIVEVIPDYRGYRFFLLPDGRIVIVEPSTLRIVLILD